MFHPFLTFVANLKARFVVGVVPVTESDFFSFPGDLLAMEPCLRAVIRVGAHGWLFGAWCCGVYDQWHMGTIWES